MEYIQPKIKKQYDLSFKINAQLGFGHLRRNISNSNYSYTALTFGSQVVVLAQNQAFTAGSALSIYVNTELPVVFTGTTEGDVVIAFTVNKMLLLDQVFKSWSLTNLGVESTKIIAHWASGDTTSTGAVVTP